MKMKDIKTFLLSLQSRKFLAMFLGAVLTYVAQSNGIPNETIAMANALIGSYIVGESINDASRNAGQTSKYAPLLNAALNLLVSQNSAPSAINTSGDVTVTNNPPSPTATSNVAQNREPSLQDMAMELGEEKVRNLFKGALGK